MPARTRTSGGSSPVATTTTLRLSPSGPRSRSTNSRTSRPRSPISPTTITSAFACRAIMPSSTDLPTPGPAITPTRCPSPSVRQASRRPDAQHHGLVDAPALHGRAAARPRASPGRAAPSAGPPSSGCMRASTTRPSSASPTGSSPAAARGITTQPSRMPSISPKGTSSAVEPLKPTTSACTTRPSSSRISQAVPRATRGSEASSTSPVARTMRPCTTTGSARIEVLAQPLEVEPAHASASRRSWRTQLLEAGGQAAVDGVRAGVHHHVAGLERRRRPPARSSPG